MRRPLRIVLVAATFALAASLTTTIFAAPVAWERVDVTQHSEQGGGVLLVSGELPATASLPADAELSVPAGSELQWIGEILGGASANDPELKFTKTTVKGNDLYRFTLTKSRTAQIEVPLTESMAFDGTTYSSFIVWTATQDVPEVRLSLRVPQAAQITTSSAGAALVPGDGNYAFYTKTVKNVNAGDQLDLAVAYSLPTVAAAAAAGAAPSGGSLAVPIVLVLLVLAAFVGLIVAVRRKMAGSAAGDNEGYVAPAKAKSGRASSVAVEMDDAQVEEAEVPAEADSSKAPLSGKSKRNLVTAVIIGVLIVAAIAVGVQTTKPKITGDTISQTFSSAEPCATANIPLTVAKGADPSETAEALFAAIKPIPGLTTATYNLKTASIDIGYCESSSSEAALRQALAPTGMVAAGGAAVAPAQ